MSARLRIAAVGVGRIGVFHARHVQEVARQRGDCELVAVVDGHADLAGRVAAQLQAGQEAPLRAFADVEELVAAGAADGAVIASRTADHYRDARALVEAGLRVLLEKPLTHSLETARQFAAWLEGDAFGKTAVMQAFMRRYDTPLRRARELVVAGAIGAPFKIVSALEDPLPPPDGYSSPGLLADMAVHNADEIMWLSGRRPDRVQGFGNRLYNQRVSSVVEDFDDAFVQLGFGGDLVGQICVSRNHVAGYRNETWVYGDEGLVHVGAFQEDVLKVELEAYGRGGAVIEKRSFPLRDYGGGVPVFIERFGVAYRAQVEDYVEKCLRGQAFAVDHADGLRALEVVMAGAQALQGGAAPAAVVYAGR